MKLKDLKWDPWDSSKPTLWQISYLNQLMLQTDIHVDVDETREDYGRAITHLKAIRSDLRNKQLIY